MSAVTYGESYAPAAMPRKKGWFARVLDHMIEARMQQAARQVEMHLGYLPEELRQRHRQMVKYGQKNA